MILASYCLLWRALLRWSRPSQPSINILPQLCQSSLACADLLGLTRTDYSFQRSPTAYR